MKFSLLWLVSLWIAGCFAADGGSGQYYSDDSGRYYPDPNEGRYFPDNSGQYIPDYSGNYKPDGTGGYRDDGSGRYSGQRDGFGGSGFGAGRFGAGGAGFGSGNLLGAGTRTVPRPVPNPFAGSQASATSNVGVRAGAGAFSAATGVGRYNDEGKWKILRQVQDIDGDGYHWEYLTENKINAEETGRIFNKGTDAEALRAQGFFKYTGPDNVEYYVSYTADENGFVPQGAHLPTPPPIPEAIQKSLAYQRANGELQ